MSTTASERACDLLVVGGGIVGLSCAWKASRAGASVVVVDPSPGEGATRAAAGMLAAVTEAHYGEGPLLELNLRSARQWPSFAAELEEASGESLGYSSEGTLAVAFDASDKAALDELGRFHEELGLASRPVSALEARRLEPLLAPSISGGLDVGGDHQVDPRRVASALIAACLESGASLVRERAEQLLVAHGSCEGARTASGERLKAGTTLLSTGWQMTLAKDAPGLAPLPLRPVKGQILRLAMRSGLPRPGRTLRGIVRGRSVYLVPRADGGLVVGATVEEMGADTTVTAGAVYSLLRDAQAILPVVTEAELTEATAGLRPCTPDNAPLIGPSGVDRLLLATGHFRNGVLLAPVTAEIVTALAARAGEAARELPPFAAHFDPRRYTADTGRRDPHLSAL